MDQSVGIACDDGAAVRVTRGRAWLERLGHAGIAPIRRLASALSARLGWPVPTPGWLFPTHPEPGQPLAADKETTQAAVARRLRSARLHRLDASATRGRRVEDLLQQAMERKAGEALPDARTSPPDAFLVLTPACLADLRQQPRRFARQLRDLLQEIPTAGVLLVEEQGTVTLLGTVAEVLRGLRAEVGDPSGPRADASPGGDERQPGNEQPAPGEDDPEAEAGSAADPGDGSTVLLEEDPEDPEEDSVGPG